MAIPSRSTSVGGSPRYGGDAPHVGARGAAAPSSFDEPESGRRVGKADQSPTGLCATESGNPAVKLRTAERNGRLTGIS